MSAGQGSCPLPWHRASFLADLFPQSQPHRAALEVRQKTVPLFDLLQRLRRLQTGHLRLPCSNQHRPQGHSRFPPHPPFPDILKITDREEVKYNFAEAEAVDNVEGNMLRTAMRGATALPWSETPLRLNGTRRNLGDLISLNLLWRMRATTGSRGDEAVAEAVRSRTAA